MTDSNVDGTARKLGQDLAHNYLARRPAPHGWRERVSGIDMAYRTQDALIDTFSASGQGAVAGYKIGMTSERMQQLCGITMPISGKLLRAGIHEDGVVLHRADHIHLGVESELGFIIADDIDRPLDGSDDEVLGLIASAHAAFEVVDDRNADFSCLVASELVAENVWGIGAVLGEGVSPSRLGPIHGLAARYFEDGEEIAAGSTRDVLGNPLNAVRWLAGFLLDRGRKLRAGDLVMTGSIGPLRFPTSAVACRFEIEGLPPVEIRIV